MALGPEDFDDPISRPLPTGLVYRHREDMPEGFEIRPEVVTAMAVRREDIDRRFHRAPADAQAIVAKQAGASVLQEISIN
jgi:hypothetical protein